MPTRVHLARVLHKASLSSVDGLVVHTARLNCGFEGSRVEEPSARVVSGRVPPRPLGRGEHGSIGAELGGGHIYKEGLTRKRLLWAFGTFDAKEDVSGKGSSWIGSASMSLRRATTGSCPDLPPRIGQRGDDMLSNGELIEELEVLCEAVQKGGEGFREIKRQRSETTCESGHCVLAIPNGRDQSMPGHWVLVWYADLVQSCERVWLRRDTRHNL